MKKVLAIVLSGVVLVATAFTFAACSSGNAAQKETSNVFTPSHTISYQSADPSNTAYVKDCAYQNDASDDVYTTDTDYSYAGGDVFANYRSNTEIYQKLYHTILDSGANGYAICNVYGIDGQVLLLSYGDIEAYRYYDVYQILGDDLNYVGQLSGAHTVAYIGDDGMLGIAKAHMGYYTYGPVLYNDGALDALCNQEGVVSADESYPSIPGDEIVFFGTDNLTGISQF